MYKPKLIPALALFLCAVRTIAGGMSLPENTMEVSPFVSEPRFNQSILEYLWDPTVERSLKIPSDLRDVSADSLDIMGPLSVAEFVLRHAPLSPVVYPTEHYYYFEFVYNERRISGNLRFTDVSDGVLHIGYFDRFDKGFLQYASLSAEDGLSVVWDPDSHRADVSLGDIRRKFAIPIPETRVPVLGDGEVHIARILDESGFGLHLVFHEPSAQFYFLLAEDAPLPDRLVRIITDPVVEVGVRSRFIFLTDPTLGRRVLVGVNRASIAANDYYDGPFDQVPPDLSIRDRLEASYPYVKLRGGIDEHGVFKELKGQRVAISPYMEYSTLQEVRTRIELGYDSAVSSPYSFVALIHESKRDAHKRLLGKAGVEPVSIKAHDQEVSRTWPVRHWQRWSNHWPTGHQQPSSLLAPANEPLDVP